jgi:hypothetical protein
MNSNPFFLIEQISDLDVMQVKWALFVIDIDISLWLACVQGDDDAYSKKRIYKAKQDSRK